MLVFIIQQVVAKFHAIVSNVNQFNGKPNLSSPSLHCVSWLNVGKFSHYSCVQMHISCFNLRDNIVKRFIFIIHLSYCKMSCTSSNVNRINRLPFMSCIMAHCREI